MAGFVTPILASSMLSHACDVSKIMPGPVRSGCKAIDERALDGGFRRGEVTAIAGSSATGKTTTALHAIATCLIRDKTSEAALLDTNGFFSPLRIRDLVMSRLASNLNEGHEEKGYVYRRASSKVLPDEERLKEMATEVLSRIKVMRVVDLIGIIEALHEIGAVCEKLASRFIRTFSETEGEISYKMGSEIPNSQDDEGDVVLDEVKIISHSRSQDLSPMRPIQMLVIDNIANHAGAELSSNQIEGQALITTCMRSLRTITKQYNLCTIVINNVVGTKLGNGQRYAHALQEDVSVFASVHGKPALGKTFGHFVDTSILISKIPARTRDAQLAMNEEKGFPNVTWRSLLVMEILYDRYGSRQGRWSAFDVVNGFDLASDPP